MLFRSCYNNHFAEPMTIPIFGKYNDYGGIEEIEEKSNIVFEHFKILINSGKLKLDSGTRNADCVEQALDSLELLIDAIGQNALVAGKDFVTGLKVSYVMCHNITVVVINQLKLKMLLRYMQNRKINDRASYLFVSRFYTGYITCLVLFRSI